MNVTKFYFIRDGIYYTGCTVTNNHGVAVVRSNEMQPGDVEVTKEQHDQAEQQLRDTFSSALLNAQYEMNVKYNNAKMKLLAIGLTEEEIVSLRSNG